jgi:hypothetical protein
MDIQKAEAAQVAVRVAGELAEAAGVRKVRVCGFDEATARVVDETLREVGILKISAKTLF